MKPKVIPVALPEEPEKQEKPKAKHLKARIEHRQSSRRFLYRHNKVLCAHMMKEQSRSEKTPGPAPSLSLSVYMYVM